MQFSVTFSGPVIVDAKDLADLLGKAHGLCEVEAIHQQQEVVAEAKKEPEAPAQSRPRGRPAAAKKEEPVVTQDKKPIHEEQVDDPGLPDKPDGDLLSRFTALVDKNYDSALQLLENFGVDRFSNLKTDQVEGFSKALEELGV